MDEILKTLRDENDPDKICTACRLAVKKMRSYHHSYSKLKGDINRWVNFYDMGTCFMTVFLINKRNQAILPLIVDALIELMHLHPSSKSQLAMKGIFFNVMELLPTSQSKEATEDRDLICVYKLAVALVENCPENLSYCFQSDLINSILYNFDMYHSNKDIMTLTLHLLSEFIFYDEDEGNEINESISQLKNSWCNLCFSHKVDSYPIPSCILEVMNHFIQGNSSVQLFGLKCLRSFSYFYDGGAALLVESGALDTVIHACFLYDDNQTIQLHGFCFIAGIFKQVDFSEVSSKAESVCELITKQLLKSDHNLDSLPALCKALKSLLLVGNGLAESLLNNNLPSAAFHVLNSTYDRLCFSSDDYISIIYSDLSFCVYLMLANSERDIRNDLLMAAFENSEVGFALCLLYLGANINFVGTNGLSYLDVACQRQDKSLIKQVFCLLSIFQHAGLWKSRIENLTNCFKTSFYKANHDTTAAMLWYLLDRDLNGEAEWSNLGLHQLKASWLETAFAVKSKAKDLTKKNLFHIYQSKSYQLGACILASNYASTEQREKPLNVEDLLENKFSLFNDLTHNDKKSPLQELYSLMESYSFPVVNEGSFARSLSTDSNDYTCQKCSPFPAFQDNLKLSYSEETQLEESSHKKPDVKCTCEVNFPPSHITRVDIKVIQLSRNGLTSMLPFAHLSQTARNRLHSVERINLFANNLTAFESSIAQIFANVVELVLSKNQFLKFPIEILKNCFRLELLDLSDNLIEDCFLVSSDQSLVNFIAPDLKHNLKTLKLASNSLAVFPSWIFQLLPNLVHLDLRKNIIKNLPGPNLFLGEELETAKLVNLDHLDISQNDLSVFSTLLLHRMPNLKHLNLSQNKIEEVELADVGFLSKSNLRYFDMSDNHLKEIPHIVCYLPKLEKLLLSTNSINCAQIKARWKTKRLVEIDLSNNHISDIKDLVSVLTAYCSSLKVLNVSNNELIVLPTALGEMKALETLDISTNQLQGLPDELGHLSNLSTFLIYGNQLDLDESIMKGRAREICQFLYARLKKSVPQNRVKLMLIGDPEAGKTTLLKSLMKKRTRKFSGSLLSDVIGGVEPKSTMNLATVGVDVVEMNLKHGNRVFEVSAWDFAGQEDFYATHPCFMSERAMYIALYDASKGPNQLFSLKPWLTAIHARATHCPVLIVGSHSDLIPRNKDEAISLLKKELLSMSNQPWFPRGAFKSNSLNHEILDVREFSPLLKATIGGIIVDSVVQGRPLVGDMIPYSYVSLTDVLKEEAKKKEDFPMINFNDLVSLIQTNTDLGAPYFESGSELMMAVKYLHQTGILLHFDDHRSRLRDCFFINPAWLCKLLARVVTMKHDSSYKINPYINNEGVLSREKFERNFFNEKTKNSIPGSFLPRLFRLLENFEVVLSKGGDHYLVPSRLPTRKPDIKLPVQSSSSRLIRYFSMIYMPMGLWPRLTARLLACADKILHGYSTSHGNQLSSPSVTKLWSKGLYFEWKKTGGDTPSFVLVQSGSQEYDNATKQASSAGNIRHRFPSESDGREGLEVVVPRTKSGQILLAQLVDHISNLVEEWYPGLLRPDFRGRSLFQQYSPCFLCEDLSEDELKRVYAFCIDDVAESATRDKKRKLSSEKSRYQVIASESVLLVYCPYHMNMPLPVAQLAPEINLDDFDASLRLDPALLNFEATNVNMLGGGAFGSVFQATYDNEDVAVKTFYASTSDMPYKLLRAELNVLAQHQHPSIISLKGFVPPVFSSPSLPLPLLVIEYAKLGSLGKLLSSMSKLTLEARNSALSATMRHRIAYEVADGLCFLHRQNIVYRDLKPDNILLMSLSPSAAAVAKITDYGISTLSSPAGTPGACGSPGYSAPEVVSFRMGDNQQPNNLFPYSNKCDVYSFGLLLHELAVGKSPWVDYVHEEHNSEKGTTIIKSNQPDDVILKGILPSPFVRYQGLSWPHAQDIVNMCLRRNPEERPACLQVVDILSEVQSTCLRSFESICPTRPTFARVYGNIAKVEKMEMQRSVSVLEDSSTKKQQNAFTVADMCYHVNEFDDESKSTKCNLMRISLDVTKGRNLRDDVYLQMDADHKISCMIRLPGTVFLPKFVARQKSLNPTNFQSVRLTDSDPVLIAATHRNHLLLISSGNYEVRAQLPDKVTSLHFHPLKSSRGTNASSYVIVALENSSLTMYTTDQLLHRSGEPPLHSLSLSSVVGRSPVTTMESSGSIVYVACGNSIVSVIAADSGPPSIERAVQTNLSIQLFAVGLNHCYTSARESDVVMVWGKGDVSARSSIDVAKVLTKRKKKRFDSSVIITSLFVDSRNSALWVGLHSGHVIVFAEPHHEVLTITRSHFGIISQIFLLEGVINGDNAVVCVGQGYRSATCGLTQMNDHPSNEKSRSDDSPFYLTFWDADLPWKAVLLKSVFSARSKWTPR